MTFWCVKCIKVIPYIVQNQEGNGCFLYLRTHSIHENIEIPKIVIRKNIRDIFVNLCGIFVNVSDIFGKDSDIYVNRVANSYFVPTQR